MNDLIAGLCIPVVVYALITLLHLVVPARHVAGYVKGLDGAPLRYRLNGLRVLVVAVALWAAVSHFGVLPWDFIYTHRVASFASACAIGLVFSVAVVAGAPQTGRSLPADFFFGRTENPQWFGNRIDAKMWLYLVGAVMLALNLLAAAAHHVMAFGDDSNAGVFVYVALFFWFICEYLFFEEVHLYTYDFFAERLGFKLGWGCLTFYPYFYGVGLLSMAGDAPAHPPTWSIVVAAVVFFCGWFLARGANMQKFTFKTRPTAKFLGLIEPKTVEGDGRALLISGFWGLSRHINYLGEFLMASGLALALGTAAPLAWLYPLYYLLLLVPRQFDDDRRCAAKYGPLWSEYKRLVPRRIVPLLF